jgi:hypothetical protein
MGILPPLVTLLRGMGTNDAGGGALENDDAEYGNAGQGVVGQEGQH